MSRRYFAVVNIATGNVIYDGASDAAAAHAYVNGTCHGSGRSCPDAIRNARATAEKLKRTMRRKPLPKNDSNR